MKDTIEDGEGPSGASDEEDADLNMLRNSLGTTANKKIFKVDQNTIKEGKKSEREN